MLTHLCSSQGSVLPVPVNVSDRIQSCYCHGTSEGLWMFLDLFSLYTAFGWPHRYFVIVSASVNCSKPIKSNTQPAQLKKLRFFCLQISFSVRISNLLPRYRSDFALFPRNRNSAQLPPYISFSNGFCKVLNILTNSLPRPIFYYEG